jgi:formate dehydrogenase major subunit
VPGLGARLGRGGATTFLQDLANSDCVVIMGANMAENHPVGFRFVVAAKERGATVIHVDPRFTRTSALADVHVPLRAGSDIVFLGALINHVLANGLHFEEYVKHYTNASVIVGEEFRDTEDLAGLFSGYVEEERRYDFDSWQYAGQAAPPASSADQNQDAQAYTQRVGLTDRPLQTDPSLQDPRCVFQIVKRHFARYTPDEVERLCGVPPALFERVADAITRNSNRDRTTSFAYAVAWTQHTTGTQMISCCALLQLLLGNIGRPGGGIMALRGHATIQGSTDIPTLYNLLPGYLPMPNTAERHGTIEEYLDAIRAPTGWWHHAPDYAVSLLKAYYGDAARSENGFAYDLLPKIGGDYSFQPMLLMMKDGAMRGLFCMGQNPAVGGQNAILARQGLATLDWLVVRDVVETESATFWRDAPEVRDGSVRADQIGTEVFLLPAALTPEKEGSYTNTQRLVQWHDKAVEPPGDARSEAWFVADLGRRLKELYAGEETAAARQLDALAWSYPTDQRGEPDLEAVVKEINGYTVRDGRPVATYEELRADGSTACGCWIYSGIMPEHGRNLARSRDGDERAALGWGFSWPANRRILYNRASARPDGTPWSERKRWVWWDRDAERWTGYDVPDFPATKPPDYRPPTHAVGMAAHAGDAPFVMTASGTGHLYAPVGLRDGPLPAHYEPWETPTRNHLYPDQERSPTAKLHERPDNPYHAPADPRFPHVLTTYRLTEHHTAGAMSRFVPWLAELQPEGFAEIDPVLARRLGVTNGGWIVISTLRGAIETRVLVTPRLQPLRIDGHRLHQIGLPWHYGYGGIARGAIANDLAALVEDPNSLIHEAKSFTCDARSGRLRDEPRPDEPGDRDRR